MQHLGQLVVVRSFLSESEAHIVVSYLESKAIEAAISHIDPWPSTILGPAQGIHLIVAVADADRARKLLEPADLKHISESGSYAKDANDVQVLVKGFTEEISRQLKAIRRRRLLVWGVFFSYFPVAVVFFAISQSEIATMYLCIVWGVVFMLTGLLLYSSKCPRCGEPFHGRWYFRWPWTRKCLNCKLSIRADQRT